MHHRIIIIGKQGTGKGTQAKLLVDKFGLDHISTGDAFRLAIKKGTPAGLKANNYINDGNLVPDETTNSIVKEYFTVNPESLNDFILDGYPRNTAQADFLQDYLGEEHAITHVIVLDAPRDILIKRMSARRVCEECGKTSSAGMLNIMVCKYCSGKLFQREDDKPEAIEKRIALYDEKTKPLIDYYDQKVPVKFFDANQAIETLSEQILNSL